MTNGVCSQSQCICVALHTYIHRDHNNIMPDCEIYASHHAWLDKLTLAFYGKSHQIYLRFGR